MSTIILIGSNGQKIGEIEYSKAKQMADEQGNDLILISKTGQQDVYKLGNAGKLKYEKKQKRRVQRAQQRAQRTKEIQIRPTIEANDLDIKVKRVRGFLSSGLKTKLVMRFKNRQYMFRESGMQKVVDVVGQLVEEGLATADREPKFEGNNIVVLLTPKD